MFKSGWFLKFRCRCKFWKEKWFRTSWRWEKRQYYWSYGVLKLQENSRQSYLFFSIDIKAQWKRVRVGWFAHVRKIRKYSTVRWARESARDEKKYWLGASWAKLMLNYMALLCLITHLDLFIKARHVQHVVVPLLTCAWLCDHMDCSMPGFLVLCGKDYNTKNKWPHILCIFFICQFICVYVGMKWSEVAQSCPTLCDPMDCSLLRSSIHGIFQARVLEWVAISFSRGSSWSRDQTQVSHTVGRRFTVWATREVRMYVW